MKYLCIQSVTGLFNKYSNICNVSLSNSLVTPYIIEIVIELKKYII
jgi:hypothetical protein